MKYPESVITVNKRGKRLLRKLLGRGKFVWYEYRNPETLEKEENGKIRIFLKDEKGKIYSYFLIPLKNNRFLVIKADEDQNKIVWNDEKKRAESLWGEEK